MTARRLAKLVRRPKRARVDASALFMAGGIVASLLLLVLVLQQVVPTGRAIIETLPAPEFAAFVPAGAIATGATLELPDLPQPAYVVAYSMNGVAGLALVEWDRDAAKYALGGTLTLDVSPTYRLVYVDEITLELMGTGEQIIAVHGHNVWQILGGPATEIRGMFLVARGANGLAIVRTESPDSGRSDLPAYYGRGDEAWESLWFEDKDGDGRKEVVLSFKFINRHPDAPAGRIVVWRWENGRLAYDQDLSAALTISASIFPEPPTESTP